MKLKTSSGTQVETLRIAAMQPKKSVGLLGGGFNPVHYGHLLIADQVCHQLSLDEFYLVPSFESPHVDPKQTISADKRVEMLKLATEDNPNLSLDLSEITRGGKSYTFDTIQSMIEKNPDTLYYFVIGGDMVEYLSTWYRIDELVEMVQFVGVNRPGYLKETPYPIIWVDVPLMSLSSTAIRQKIKQGCSVKYFLPDSVIDYIMKEGLYKE
ncbi:nicotinate-nucleotide adenylyltransferase [Vagococcus sp.]|uniref:nicotinate-nucleotide adenylyltransferase n=1 Tax=Vagococcus sp. TaxID=1933889 RepID=UPI003F9A09A5